MARPRAEAPTLRYHISGLSVVTLDGKDYYLGKHNSPESLARYAVLINRYQQNGLRLPEGFELSELEGEALSLLAPSPQQVHLENEPLTVKHLTASYREYIREKYSSRSEVARKCKVCDALDTHFGEMRIEQFGPKALLLQRSRWLKDGDKCRSYVNKCCGEVVRCFKWGVSQEIVEESTWRRLISIEPLRSGEGFENAKRQPVSIDVVRATACELSPIVKAMLAIHIQTGMRPAELCDMRPKDIDRSGEVWLYRPAQHKTKHHGKPRVIPILGDAREALIEYLNRAPDSHCFSPKEADAWFRAKLRSERKGYGSYKPTKGTLRAGTKYSPQSYRQAIERAAKRAKVGHWVPYQLRHLNLTEVRQALGIEHAQALGGHSRMDMTEHYAQQTIERAIEAARSAPTLKTKGQ